MPASSDPELAPWFDRVRADLPGLDLVDVHTHIGANDPDGFKQSEAELLERLDAAGARGVVFPMHEPDGYRAANDAVIAAAAASGGRLTAFCRVDPRTGAAAVAEAQRALDAGARGIKLHPRAEAFSLDAPAARDLAALAGARGVPILIHAGRGIPALGRHTLSLAAEFPAARLILAHAAISDLAWLWRELDDHPNVFVDTAWWSPADLLALFAYVPPGRILFASDAPYGSTVQAALLAFRCALQAGLNPEQIVEVAGRQTDRLLAGEEPLDLGPAPGAVAERFVLDPLLDRIATYLTTAMGRIVSELDDGAESLALARLGCAVGEDSPHATLCAQTLELLDRYEAYVAAPGAKLRFSELGILTSALTLVRTPAVGLPELGSEPRPVRSEIPA